jgi:hypothetical protein
VAAAITGDPFPRSGKNARRSSLITLGGRPWLVTLTRIDTRVLRGVAALAVLGALLAGAWPGGGSPAIVARPLPSPSASPSPSPTAFTSSVEPLSGAIQAEMIGVSWREGCPVPLSELRLVRLTHFGFDDRLHEGELVVNADVADKIVRVFQKVYAARFPIRKMVRIEAYGGDDERSMADDNTSAFNCRVVYGTDHWSMHAYGRAVDVNTIENPNLPQPGVVRPSEGGPFANRGALRPGMLTYGDPVVRAFLAEGFRWGGAWPDSPDYQHFAY